MEDFVDEFNIIGGSEDAKNFNLIMSWLKEEGVNKAIEWLTTPLEEYIIQYEDGTPAKGDSRPPEDSFLMVKYDCDFLKAIIEVTEFSEGDMDYIISQVIWGKLERFYQFRTASGKKIGDIAKEVVDSKYWDGGLNNEKAKASRESSDLFKKYGTHHETMASPMYQKSWWQRK